MRHAKMTNLLTKNLKIEEIWLENESSNHSVPIGSETHFKLFLVSADFQGQSRVERQRLIQTLLADEFSQGLHALTMRLLTPQERLAQGPENFISPECRGGSKAKS